MKNLILVLILGFGLNSCVKKEEEEVVPYVCQNCIQMEEVVIMSYNQDTIFSSRIDTVRFTYCGTYEYENNVHSSSGPIYAFDSLGNGYVKGWSSKLVFYWHCENKDGYGILTPQ
jgi:hypothetical protein